MKFFGWVKMLDNLKRDSSISCHDGNPKILVIYKKKCLSILSFLLKFEQNASIHRLYRKYKNYFVLQNV